MITIRKATTEKQDFDTIFAMLILQHGEVGRVPMNREKTAKTAFETIATGFALIIESNGEPIGSCGFVENEFWYGDEKFWDENWLWIMPSHRDARTFRHLIAVFKDIADKTEMAVSFMVFNEKRSGRPMELVGELYGVLPMGARVMMSPDMKEPEDERRQQEIDDEFHQSGNPS